MKKIIFLVIDGLPDEKMPELENQTPLEAAHRPNLDYLAQNGWCGFFKPLFLGKLPDSEEVHLSLFGYDPKKNFPGRGVLEALGLGLKIRPTDIVVRGNLASIGGNGRVFDRRAGRIKTNEAKRTIGILDGLVIEKIKFIVKPIYDHRFVIILRGRGLSAEISDTDEKNIVGKKPLFCRPLTKNKTAEFTADVLNKFIARAETLLASQSQANFILTRSAGRLEKVPSFEQRWGLKAGCVSLGNLYRGIGRHLGMDIIKEKGGDSFSAAYLKNKFLTVRKALKKYGFIFCHIKGADLLAEDGKAREKKEFIEAIDKQLPILENLKSVLLVVTSDHATSSRQKSHAKFPIPILIYPARKGRLNQKFTERDCRKGNLGEVQNLKILPLVLKIASEN